MCRVLSIDSAELPVIWDGDFMYGPRTRPGKLPTCSARSTSARSIRSPHTYAKSVGIAVTAAVVDEAGIPIAVGRMDGAATQTTELAVSKAYTAGRVSPRDGGSRCSGASALAEEPPRRASRAAPTRGRRSRDLRRHHDHRRRRRRGRQHIDQDVLCCQAAFSVLETEVAEPGSRQTPGRATGAGR